ncbi:MAG: alpha/beta fold hydrolase [Chloroflexi bacterium]|nr:MAG: alpha/beta fold hydrolase [Chloroflexota bacterium]
MPPLSTRSADGVRMIEVTTPRGPFKVWTKRVGNNPRIKLLLLHGGPGFPHEYFEAFDDYLPNEGIEYLYYDQLGSYYSDQPEMTDEMLALPRFVDEVEQVRRALRLDTDSFYLLGQSWGGLLAIEYALKHQDHLKALIISNMMASIPQYNDYAKNVLMPAMDPKVLAEAKQLEAAGKYEDPRYLELLIPNHYEKHVIRMPMNQWPDPLKRSFDHMNPKVYIPMQGPSELGASGKLANWDRTADLKNITVPTLIIGARFDTMDPKHMEWMSKQIPKGQYLYCPNGSHLAMYDDQRTYMRGLVEFMKGVDSAMTNERSSSSHV